MRNWIVKSTLLGLAVTTLFATPAVAQTTSGGMRIGAGLSMQFDDTADSTGIGFTADVRRDFRPMGPSANLGWVADFSLHSFGDDDFTTVGFLGGIAVNVPANDTVSFYGQFLLGIEHCCETNAFAIQPGAGINFQLTPTLGIRGAFDYRRAKYNEVWFGTPRIWFGITALLGGM